MTVQTVPKVNIGFSHHVKGTEVLLWSSPTVEWTRPAKRNRRHYIPHPCDAHIPTSFLMCVSQQEWNGMLWLCKYHVLDPTPVLTRNGCGCSVCCIGNLTTESEHTAQKYKHSTLSSSREAVGSKDATPGKHHGLSCPAHAKSNVSPTQQDGSMLTLTG